MDRRAVEKWVDRYELCWRTPGTEHLDELFVPAATYLPSPWSRLLEGLDEIAELWESERDGADEDFTMSSDVVTVDGNTAVVRVFVEYATPGAGRWRDLWVLQLTDDGRASVRGVAVRSGPTGWALDRTGSGPDPGDEPAALRLAGASRRDSKVSVLCPRRGKGRERNTQASKSWAESPTLRRPMEARPQRGALEKPVGVVAAALQGVVVVEITSVRRCRGLGPDANPPRAVETAAGHRDSHAIHGRPDADLEINASVQGRIDNAAALVVDIQREPTTWGCEHEGVPHVPGFPDVAEPQPNDDPLMSMQGTQGNDVSVCADRAPPGDVLQIGTGIDPHGYDVTGRIWSGKLFSRGALTRKQRQSRREAGRNHPSEIAWTVSHRETTFETH